MRRPINRFELLLVSISAAFLLVIAEIASAADDTPSKVLSAFPQNRVWIIVAIILLMAFLFGILFWWQKKIEQAGYFGRIYQDTIESMEMTRLSAPVHKDWEQGAYLNEVFLRRSPRGEQWVKENPPPKPRDELSTLASELDREYELRDIERSMKRTRFGTAGEAGGLNPFADWNRRPGGSGIGKLGGSIRPGGNLAGDAAVDRQEKERRFEDLLAQFSRDAEAWVSSAAACAWGWYQDDLEKLKAKAQEQAQQALSVDFSALRGRGPEFVLEFTAVVVIIFAAVILGLVERLSSEQIGTLLAAIAGYVLGKGSARSRSGPGEEQAAVRTPPVGGSVKTPKTSIEGGKQVVVTPNAGAPGP